MEYKLASNSIYIFTALLDSEHVLRNVSMLATGKLYVFTALNLLCCSVPKSVSYIKPKTKSASYTKVE